MSRMYPRPLPDSVRQDPRRSAEVRTWEALDTLDDDFACFWSVRWQSRDPRAAARDGEADFVVAHPRMGLLVLEVKGGRIGRDGDWWYSIDREGVRHGIQDPAEQARRNRYHLMDKLREFPGWAGRTLRAGHGVVLPDCRVEGALALDLPREIVLAHDDLVRLRQRIPELFRHYTREGDDTPGLGADGVDLLARTMARTFALRSPLGAELAEDDRRILTLTEQQLDVLDLLSCNRRVVVRGAAGTGKTVLAAEKAKRLALEGFRVLLTCFNHPLADLLAASLRGVAGVTVATFNTLCHDLAVEAGLPVDEHVQGRAEQQEFFRCVHPELLMKALDRMPERRFDAIVVDEAQDFWEEWWVPLGLCLADPDHGILYAFLDANQRVYRRPQGLPDGAVETVLTKNLRNTRLIHAEAGRYYQGAPTVAVGPEGREVERVPIPEGSTLVRELSRVLHRLIRDEGIPPGDIAILTGRALSHGGLDAVDRIGAFPVTRDPAAAGFVVVQSVHRFKGLERPVVILADLESLAAPFADQVMYVGLTRARGHVVVVGGADGYSARNGSSS